MLEFLYSNKNVEKILIYLLLHNKANATELKKIFETSLDPIQKTLFKKATRYQKGKDLVKQEIRCK